MPVPSRRLLASLGVALVLGSTLSCASEDRVVLESDELRVTIDPASNGRIASIRSKKNGVEHLEPAVIREEVQSPLLPTTIVSNHGGVEDWFWKQYVTPRIAFRLKDQGGSPAGPWATVIGNINGIHVERRMTLLKSFPALQVDVMLSSDAPVDASYWLHIVVAGNHYLDKESGKGMLAGTFSGDPTPRQGRGMLALKQAGPQTVPIAFGDIALAPAGNWFARIATDGSDSLALVVEKDFGKSEGFFYAWQDTQTRIGSLEAVWPKVKIGSSQSRAPQPGEVHLRYFLAVIEETDPVRLDQLLGKLSSPEIPSP